MPYKKLDTKQKNPKSYGRKASKNEEGETPQGFHWKLLKLLTLTVVSYKMKIL
jgi:hypothetical protein